MPAPCSVSVNSTETLPQVPDYTLSQSGRRQHVFIKYSLIELSSVFRQVEMWYLDDFLILFWTVSIFGLTKSVPPSSVSSSSWYDFHFSLKWVHNTEPNLIISFCELFCVFFYLSWGSPRFSLYFRISVFPLYLCTWMLRHQSANLLETSSVFAVHCSGYFTTSWIVDFLFSAYRFHFRYSTALCFLYTLCFSGILNSAR